MSEDKKAEKGRKEKERAGLADRNRNHEQTKEEGNVFNQGSDHRSNDQKTSRSRVSLTNSRSCHTARHPRSQRAGLPRDSFRAYRILYGVVLDGLALYSIYLLESAASRPSTVGNAM